jgi:hypothetical protein
MNEEQKYELPKESKGDVAHSIAKAALSTVPLVGGAAEELFALVITPRLQKRQAEWVNEVPEGLTGLQKKVKEFSIEKLLSST